ncbi:signal peptidase I [Carnobacterium gallinarum]|uniref:signal peptidase I n=1 Tax=Carnobacterium gallinarum TaxID=2749 RepID=UPI000554021C|nr:signal peptidase I [Carnobacterium gallinarum]
MKNKAWRDHLWDWFKALILAGCVVVLLRYFLLLPIMVQGSSMIPTLHQGDQMIVESISKIKRFDVIVFQDASERTLVKRVIGLPGEEIRYDHDQLYVNNKEVSEPFLKNNLVEAAGETWTSNFDLKQLTGVNKIPKDSYFVLGDNRRSSNDSRVFGFITKDEIIGKTNFVYYPFKRMTAIN